MQRNWDIFCRVIDNYGDIGVCWRLARQLVAEHGLTVRLWVDDLNSLAWLCPEIDPAQPKQLAAGVDVRRWPAAFPAVTVPDVVVEAFACDLPETYRQAMTKCPTQALWLNLEYLSAESWVEGCHALASPQPPLIKYFFFPGFTPGTGGLLREMGILEQRDLWRATQPSSTSLEISLFCYETAPLKGLFAAWRKGLPAIRCRVAPGKPLAAVQHLLTGVGPWQSGKLRIEPIPFVSQETFDHLLWRCDINFVRGEDSFIRAQWAGVPLVWHIYPQQDEAHLAKLDAFLDLYCKDLPPLAAAAMRQLNHAWNRGKNIADVWPDFLLQLPVLKVHAIQWSHQLAMQGDLAANLVKFCTSKI